MRTGYIISGIAHGVLMLWLLFGGLISRERDEPFVLVAEVSLISGAEFAALSEASAPPVTAAPEVSAPPPARPEPQPEPEPLPQPEPEPEPQPEPEPEPEPQPEPEPEPVTPPQADRVADEVIEAPDETLPEGPTLVEDTAPAAEAEPETPVEQLPAQAPPAQTTEIVTEAETPTNAPTASIRPRSRPTPPAPTPAPREPAPEPETQTAAAEPALDAAIDSAVDDALADVLGEAAAAATPAGPSGPPLTQGERDGLRVAVQQCWNVGSLSTDALATTVVVLVKMARDGRPESVDLVSSNGSGTATSRAFEAARRAVIRCGATGFPLPADKYDQWREIEMTFDPTNMRIK